MGRDNLIIGAILAAFFIYVTAKGDLPSYLSDLGIGGNASGGTSTGVGAAVNTLGSAAGSPPDFGTVGNFLTRPGTVAPPDFLPPPNIPYM